MQARESCSTLVLSRPVAGRTWNQPRDSELTCGRTPFEACAGAQGGDARRRCARGLRGHDGAPAAHRARCGAPGGAPGCVHARAAVQWRPGLCLRGAPCSQQLAPCARPQAWPHLLLQRCPHMRLQGLSAATTGSVHDCIAICACALSCMHACAQSRASFASSGQQVVLEAPVGVAASPERQRGRAHAVGFACRRARRRCTGRRSMRCRTLSW